MTLRASQKPFPARAPWQLGPSRASCTFLRESCLAVHSALRSLCQGTEKFPTLFFPTLLFPTLILSPLSGDGEANSPDVPRHVRREVRVWLLREIHLFLLVLWPDARTSQLIMLGFVVLLQNNAPRKRRERPSTRRPAT